MNTEETKLITGLIDIYNRTKNIAVYLGDLEEWPEEKQPSSPITHALDLVVLTSRKIQYIETEVKKLR